MGQATPDDLVYVKDVVVWSIFENALDIGWR
jgi:hypothetical protein